jgi:hypothetical protein
MRYDMKRNLYLLLLLLLGTSPIPAQTTAGRDFWVTLLPNGRQGETSEPMISITGNSSFTTGSVSNPNTGWSENFSVEAGQTVYVPVPLEEAVEMHLSDTVLNIGLHVTAKHPVSVCVANYRNATFDTSKALPTHVLGSEYLVQTYEAFGTYEHMRSVLSIVATEDNTTVDFQLSCETMNGHLANQPLSVTLDAGQVYQLQSAHLCNFSGTRVTARDGKPIAVFAGNRGLGVPYYNTPYIDHAEDIMLPATTLGRHFVVTHSTLPFPDYVRVTALKDHCEVRRDGTLLRTLNASQSFHFELTGEQPAIYLETTEPALVCKFYHGYDDYVPNHIGDPAMVTILPLEQASDSASFCIFETNISHYHFVQMVTETATVAGMLLDDEAIGDLFHVVESHPEYSYASLQITDTTHSLYNSLGSFVAHVHGTGCAEAYAYFPDAAMLTTALTVNDTSEWLHPEGFYAELNEPIDFGLQLNYELAEAHWDYGDGVMEVLTGAEAWHSYSVQGNYPVTCEVFRTDAQGRQVLAGYVSTIIHAGYEGLESLVELERNKLYPNPANTQVTIEGIDILNIRLMNSYGQVVLEKTYESVNHVKLDLSDLPQGVYLVEVITEKEQMVKRLVKY